MTKNKRHTQTQRVIKTTKTTKTTKTITTATTTTTTKPTYQPRQLAVNPKSRVVNRSSTVGSRQTPIKIKKDPLAKYRKKFDLIQRRSRDHSLFRVSWAALEESANNIMNSSDPEERWCEKTEFDHLINSWKNNPLVKMLNCPATHCQVKPQPWSNIVFNMEGVIQQIQDSCYVVSSLLENDPSTNHTLNAESLLTRDHQDNQGKVTQIPDHWVKYKAETGRVEWYKYRRFSFEMDARDFAWLYLEDKSRVMNLYQVKLGDKQVDVARYRARWPDEDSNPLYTIVFESV